MCKRFLSIIVRVLVFGLFAFSVSGQTERGSVKDYYLLMPQQYDSSTFEERDEILGFVSETTVDEKNGYISYVTPLSGEVFEVALFKKSADELYLVYNQDGDPKYDQSTELYVLHLDEDGGYTDVTSKVLPVRVNPSYKYKLPRYGTTITVTDMKGRKMYSLLWKKGTFVKG